MEDECPGANIDVHTWTGASCSTLCRAAAVAHVKSAAHASRLLDRGKEPESGAASQQRTSPFKIQRPKAKASQKKDAASAADCIPHEAYLHPDGEEIFAVEELLGICVKLVKKKPHLLYKVWWKNCPKPQS